MKAQNKTDKKSEWYLLNGQISAVIRQIAVFTKMHLKHEIIKRWWDQRGEQGLSFKEAWGPW